MDAGQTWDVVASIRLFKSSQDGRRGPTPPEQFNCIMVIGELNFNVHLHLEEHGPLIPGQSARIPITFFSKLNASGHYTVGTKFVLRELRAIGEGVVEEVA